MKLRQFQLRLSQRLLLWSLASMSAGGLLVRHRLPFWRDFGRQALGWGIVDAIIGLVGARSNRRRQHDEQASAAPVLQRETRSLRRLLWISAGLDVLYIVGGFRLARHRRGRWHGHGWGVVLQGAFLFVFDMLHARALPTPAGNLEARDGGIGGTM